LDQVDQGEALDVERRLGAVQRGQQEELVDPVTEALGVAARGLHVVGERRARAARVDQVAHRFERAVQRRERRAQVVRHVRDQLAARAVGVGEGADLGAHPLPQRGDAVAEGVDLVARRRGAVGPGEVERSGRWIEAAHGRAESPQAARQEREGACPHQHHHRHAETPAPRDQPQRGARLHAPEQGGSRLVGEDHVEEAASRERGRRERRAAAATRIRAQDRVVALAGRDPFEARHRRQVDAFARERTERGRLEDAARGVQQVDLDAGVGHAQHLDQLVELLPHERTGVEAGGVGDEVARERGVLSLGHLGVVRARRRQRRRHQRGACRHQDGHQHHRQTQVQADRAPHRRGSLGTTSL
jgi:hypothetical protein